MPPICATANRSLAADETVSTGVPFTLAPLRGLETIRNFNIDLRGSAQYLERSGGKFFYFVTS